MVAKSRSAVTTSEARVTKRARIDHPAPRAPKSRVTKTSNDEHTVSKGKRKAIHNLANGSSSSALPSTFKVVAGSYEKLLYGLEGSTSIENDAVKFHLKPIFIFPAHVSCIKAVGASPGGKWLATGSADEIVKVWDLKRKKEIGGLMHHEGSITALLFPSRSHLVSASEDGTIGIFHARDWSVLRTLRGHKGRVNCVDVHPSGKVALSVGKDRMLRMWDMMRGRGVASVKLGKEGETVRWSTDGDMFAVQSGKEIDIYTTDMSLLHSITHPSRLHDIRFCRCTHEEAQVLLASAEDRKVSVYDFDKDKESVPRIVAEMVGHENRIKAIQTLRISIPYHPFSDSSTISASVHPHTTIVSTVSSDGKINVYDLADLSSTEKGTMQVIEPAATYDTKGTRLTCVTLSGSDTKSDNMIGKRIRDEEEGEEDEEESAAGDFEGQDWSGIVANEDDGEEEGEREEEEEEEG